MFGKDDGTTGVDNDFAKQGVSGISAWIPGRNMFGPIRGAWPEINWKGWWGDNPPYHTPVNASLRNIPRGSPAIFFKTLLILKCLVGNYGGKWPRLSKAVFSAS
jgi:hypothetical protein